MFMRSFRPPVRVRFRKACTPRNAHEILKVAKSGRESGRGVPPLNLPWQKESFDHIVRSPASMEIFRAYIRAHGSAQGGSGVPPLFGRGIELSQRRDAAATLIKAGL